MAEGEVDRVEEPAKKYDVHIYALVRVKVVGVEAKNEKQAIYEAEKLANLQARFESPTQDYKGQPVVQYHEWAEEVREYGVEELGNGDKANPDEINFYRPGSPHGTWGETFDPSELVSMEQFCKDLPRVVVEVEDGAVTVTADKPVRAIVLDKDVFDGVAEDEVTEPCFEYIEGENIMPTIKQYAADQDGQHMVNVWESYDDRSIGDLSKVLARAKPEKTIHLFDAGSEVTCPRCAETADASEEYGADDQGKIFLYTCPQGHYFQAQFETPGADAPVQKEPDVCEKCQGPVEDGRAICDDCDEMDKLETIKRVGSKLKLKGVASNWFIEVRQWIERNEAVVKDIEIHRAMCSLGYAEGIECSMCHMIVPAQDIHLDRDKKQICEGCWDDRMA